MRLGFAVKPLGKPLLKSHDARRWQNNPHLSVSLMYLRDIIAYLSASNISMYRASSDLAPYAAHPDLSQFHHQVQECAREVAQVGQLVCRERIRLSFHPTRQVILNSPNPDLVKRCSGYLNTQAILLDLMGLGPEAAVVIHLGGVYGNRESSRESFVRRFWLLPEPTRRRLALENDDTRFGVTDTLWVHQNTGIPLVFDYLHHRLFNPAGWQVREALNACLATWSPDVRPKIHFSTPRSDWLITPTADSNQPLVRHTRWSYHSDYINPFEFIDFVRLTQGLPEFDVMLEVRAKDLALLQLRHDLTRYAPEIAARLEPGSRHVSQGSGQPERAASHF